MKYKLVGGPLDGKIVDPGVGRVIGDIINFPHAWGGSYRDRVRGNCRYIVREGAELHYLNFVSNGSSDEAVAALTRRLRDGEIEVPVVVYKRGDELWLRVEYDGRRHAMNLSASSVGPTLVAKLRKWATFILK
jgi:hypothetical protein